MATFLALFLYFWIGYYLNRWTWRTKYRLSLYDVIFVAFWPVYLLMGIVSGIVYGGKRRG